MKLLESGLCGESNDFSVGPVFRREQPSAASNPSNVKAKHDMKLSPYWPSIKRSKLKLSAAIGITTVVIVGIWLSVLRPRITKERLALTLSGAIVEKLVSLESNERKEFDIVIDRNSAVLQLSAANKSNAKRRDNGNRSAFSQDELRRHRELKSKLNKLLAEWHAAMSRLASGETSGTVTMTHMPYGVTILSFHENISSSIFTRAKKFVFPSEFRFYQMSPLEVDVGAGTVEIIPVG